MISDGPARKPFYMTIGKSTTARSSCSLFNIDEILPTVVPKGQREDFDLFALLCEGVTMTTIKIQL
jgi:hypothetical protein